MHAAFPLAAASTEEGAWGGGKGRSHFFIFCFERLLNSNDGAEAYCCRKISGSKSMGSLIISFVSSLVGYTLTFSLRAMDDKGFSNK